MTRISLVAAAALAAALAAAVPAGAQSWRGDANLLLGLKRLDEGDWGPTDRQGELGVQADVQRSDWPVALAVDLLASGDDSAIDSRGFTEQRGRTSELDLGARKIWRPDENLRPYLGGGLALASSELELRGPFRTVSDSDSGAGLWLGGGAYWTLSRAFNLGFDAKLSHAGVRLFGDDRNAGGFHLALLLGYHWGG